MNSVGAIIRCADVPRRVYDTLAAIARQSRAVFEIVLVVDPSTPEAARPWLAGMAGSNGWTIVSAQTPMPGAVWNAGAAACTSELLLCVSAGDVLDADFVRAAVDLIEATQAHVVTADVLTVGAGLPSQIRVAIDWSRGPLADPRRAIQAPLVLMREAWSELGGFDESLATFEDLDLCCRAVADGRAGATLRTPLVVRPYRRDALHVRAWTAEGRGDAIALIATKHGLTVRDGLGQVIEDVQAYRAELRERNAALMTKREADVAEIEALRQRVAELRSVLSEDEQRAVTVEDLSRTTPVSRDWGYERGGPVDRVYIEQFLSRHAPDICGAVLEIQEADYTTRFGGDRVTRSDVLDLDAANPRATIIADMRMAANIPANTYDCVILTQTLHVIDDMRAVAAECARILKPGGVLLATLPSASRVCVEYGYGGDSWRVTESGARQVFASAFPGAGVDVASLGNVRVNAAFLYGLGGGEVSAADYAVNDPYYPLLVTVRAAKPAAITAARGAATSASGTAAGAILLYHRVASPASDVHRLAVSPADFRAQMDHLRDRYHPMPLEELADAAAHGVLPDGAIAVTFDDGYLDNFVAASPILAAAGVPATFFLTTDRLDHSQEPYEFWWDALERLLLEHVEPDAHRSLVVSLPDGERSFPAATRADRRAAHAEVYEAIVAAPADLRDRAIVSIRQWRGGLQSIGTARRMNAAEMTELARRPGHTVGAHSVRHLMLTSQPAAVRQQEISESRRTLESLTGKDVRAFAYPFGAYDSATQDAVREAGFTLAIACDDTAVPVMPDLLALPRLDPAAQGPEQRFDLWLERRCRKRPSASGR